MKILYYYTYLAYIKILPKGYSGVHLNVVTAIGLCLSFIFRFLITLPITYFFCYITPAWLNVLIIVSFIIITHLYYRNMTKEIISTKPMFFKNKYISIFIVIMYYILSFVLFFIDGYFSKEIYSNC